MFKPRYFSASSGRLAIPLAAATTLTGSYLYYRSPSNNASVGGQAERSRQKRDKEALRDAGIGNNATSGGHETGQVGSGVQPMTGDFERGFSTTAESRSQLPSGGVRGGVGAGGPSPRAIEWSGKGETRNGVDEAVSSPVSRSVTPPLQTMQPSGGEVSSSAARSSSGTGSDDAPSQDSMDSANMKVTSRTYPSSQGDYNPGKGKSSSGEASASQKLQGVFGQGGQTASRREDMEGVHDTRIASNHGETPTKRGHLRSGS